MEIQIKHRNQFALFYLFCLYVFAIFQGVHHLSLTGYAPVFFSYKLDFLQNALMLTGIHKWLLLHQQAFIFLDLLFLLLPSLLVYSILKKRSAMPALSLLTAIFSMLYSLLYTMFTFISIEIFLAWMLVPLLFCTKDLPGFYLRMHMLRILFILFFFSAALWKIKSGAIFSLDQMSGILVAQHTSYLIDPQPSTFKAVLNYLIAHPPVSYVFYLLGFLAEFSFAIGFFTKKFDKVLMVLLAGFIIADYFLMSINYFSWIPFCACFYFSRLTAPKRDFN